MGIDLKAGGRLKNKSHRTLKTNNLYHRLLVKLYKFLSRRTSSSFNSCVLKRLLNTRVHRAPVSLSRLARYATRKSVTEGKNGKDIIFTVIGTVTEDTRLYEVPKMRVCALRFTEKARERIVASNGECLTLDQLALLRPNGQNVILIRGPRDREAIKHFGPATGTPGSHAKPYVRSKGRKFERARGKRRSRGFRV